jgi:peptidoglycan-N-acetylglucosamine deacetylase
MRRSWLVVVGAVAATLGGLPVAVAGSRARQPFPIQAASLAQSGRQLVWRLELTHSFSPTVLQGERRGLCLVLERARDAAVTGHVCVAGPAKHTHAPRLSFTSLSAGRPGAARIIAATFTRPSTHALTAIFAPSSVGLAYQDLRWQALSSTCPAAAPSPGCQILMPRAPALIRLHVPRLVGCVVSGPSLVYSGPRAAHDIALTFDDGPWSQPPTSAFVNLLAREHVPATFFEVGRQIGPYDPRGSIERQMLADGDMIGNHTWDHPDLIGLTPAAQRRELDLTSAAIARVTGFTPCLFRAPYGSVDSRVLGVARALGLATIQWDVDPRDWALPGVGAIINNVIASAHDGAIVIQHCGGGPRYQTLSALPSEIAALRARGYRFVTLTQMLGYRLVYR